MMLSCLFVFLDGQCSEPLVAALCCLVLTWFLCVPRASTRLSPLYPDQLMVGMEIRDKVTSYVRERIGKPAGPLTLTLPGAAYTHVTCCAASDVTARSIWHACLSCQPGQCCCTRPPSFCLVVAQPVTYLTCLNLPCLVLQAACDERTLVSTRTCLSCATMQ